jgi:5'-nucleotidase
LYSGTIGGVIEGALKGIPGIAFSFSDLEEEPTLESTKPYIVPIIEHFLKNPLPNGTILNVNFPFKMKDGAKGFRMARQGRSHWREAPDRRIHPEGATYYWLGGQWGVHVEEENSDVAFLDKGYVAAVPIHVVQMTDEGAYQAHKELRFSEQRESQNCSPRENR